MVHGSSCCRATSNGVRRSSGSSFAAAVAVQQAMVSGEAVAARLQQAFTMYQVMEW